MGVSEEVRQLTYVFVECNLVCVAMGCVARERWRLWELWEWEKVAMGLRE